MPQRLGLGDAGREALGELLSEPDVPHGVEHDRAPVLVGDTETRIDPGLDRSFLEQRRAETVDRGHVRAVDVMEGRGQHLRFLALGVPDGVLEFGPQADLELTRGLLGERDGHDARDGHPRPQKSEQAIDEHGRLAGPRARLDQVGVLETLALTAGQSSVLRVRDCPGLVHASVIVLAQFMPVSSGLSLVTGYCPVAR